jgi:hypothetical protein
MKFFKVFLAFLVFCVNLAFMGEAQAKITTSLAWDAITDPALAGYKVRYGTESGVYTNEVDCGNVNAYAYGQGLKKVLMLSAGVRYYFAVVAYDTAGVVGYNSNEVSISFLVDTPENLILGR